MAELKAGDIDAAIDPSVSDIRDEWSWVRPGIEELLAAQPQLTYRPEDVYAKCVNSDAVLWTTDEGFLVTNVLYDEYSKDKIFFIWIAWAKKRGGANGIKHVPFFCTEAKKAGLNKIQFQSKTDAPIDFFTKNGWQVDTIVYTRDL